MDNDACYPGITGYYNQPTRYDYGHSDVRPNIPNHSHEYDYSDVHPNIPNHSKRRTVPNNRRDISTVDPHGPPSHYHGQGGGVWKHSGNELVEHHRPYGHSNCHGGVWKQYGSELVEHHPPYGHGHGGFWKHYGGSELVEHHRTYRHGRPQPPPYDHYYYSHPRMLQPVNGYRRRRALPVADDFVHFFTDDTTRGCTVM